MYYLYFLHWAHSWDLVDSTQRLWGWEHCWRLLDPRCDKFTDILLSNLRAATGRSLPLSLDCSSIMLTGHCCFCCWCCWLPRDCIHGAGSHRHGDGPRGRKPVEGRGFQIPVHLQCVLRWFGVMGIYWHGDCGDVLVDTEGMDSLSASVLVKSIFKSWYDFQHLQHYI